MMAHAEDNLVDALVRFATSAVALLRDRFDEPSLRPTWHWDWIRTGDEVFAARERTGWNTVEWYEVWNDAEKLDSYEVAIQALETDERTKGQLGQLVGTARGQSTLEPQRLFLSELIFPAVTEANTFDLHAEYFGPHAQRLIETLAVEVIEIREIVQILGIASGETEVEVGEGVVFRQMTDDEIAAHLRFNVTVSPSRDIDGLGPLIRMVPRAFQSGLVATKRLPKVVGKTDLEAFDSLGMGELADSFVAAARLRTRHNIARGRAVAFSGSWKSEPWESANFGPAQAPPSVDRIDLSDEQLKSIATLSGELREPAVQKHLGISLRRFQEVPLRAKDEDRLIDLVVAAEALFLPESGAELTHKMAVRAGMFAGVEDVSPSQVFRFMKKAYQARSRIIHGGDTKKFTRLDASEGSLSEVVQDLEIVLAAALTNGVDALINKGGLPDWDVELADLLDAKDGD